MKEILLDLRMMLKVMGWMMAFGTALFVLFVVFGSILFWFHDREKKRLEESKDKFPVALVSDGPPETQRLCRWHIGEKRQRICGFPATVWHHFQGISRDIDIHTKRPLCESHHKEILGKIFEQMPPLGERVG